MADIGKPFGKLPARSVDCFGVAGFLSENSKVFYSSIFTTKHVGRVTDLLSAKLKNEGLDELKFRALILFGTFEVFRIQGDLIGKDARLAEPLVLECGLDDDKIALGVSVTADEGRFPRLEGLVERISGKTPENEFERLLMELHCHSDRLYLRAQESTRRLEIVALLGIPGKIDAESVAERVPMVLVTIVADQRAEPPQVKSYVELGDLDYPELLKEAIATQDAAAPPTGEVLMHGFKEIDEAVKVRAEKLLEEMTGRKVAGSREGDDVIRVKGTAAAVDDSVVKIAAGESTQAGGEGSFIVKGNAADADQSSSQNYRVKSSKGAAESDSSDDQSDEEGDNPSQDTLKGVFAKVKKGWPFRLGKGDKAASDVEVSEGETDEQDEQDDVAPQAAPAQASPVVSVTTTEIQKESQKLHNEIENGFSQTLSRVQAEAAEFKTELGSPRAKRWVDGLMTELVAQKAKLAESSKELNASIKQKELEFRSKETMLTEELKRRDDLIRQKTNALERAKEQISQTAISTERLKSAAVGAVDDAHFKQKYAFAQKMLSSAKEENVALAEKVEDLKNQLVNAQNGSARRNQPSMADFSALQSKYERSIRQADEFKKANQQLVEKLSEAKKDAIKAPQDDVKKRLEAAVKIASSHQRDAEKLQQRVEEMQREQMRLKAELNKTAQELKSARVGSRGQQAAAESKLTTTKPALTTKSATVAKPGVKPGSSGEGTPPKAA